MGQYLESYRGGVRAWECDTTEHFTVAYYFDRFSQAGQRMLLELGYTPNEDSYPASLNCYSRFHQELNKGDSFYIHSGVIESSSGRILLGHRLINSETDELCTTLEQTLDGSARKETAPFEVKWDGEPREERGKVPDSAHWITTSTDVVRDHETDWSGRLDLSGCIHRFSMASVQCQSMFGMSCSYATENRIGFSTFEFQLEFNEDQPRAGEPLEVRSAVANIGRSSMHTVHQMQRVNGGTVAVLSQMGVHLDLDKRRPTPFPEALASRAREMIGT